MMGDLANKITEALGGIVPLPLRDRVNDLRKGKTKTIFIRYSEVNDEFWLAVEFLGAEISDGEAGVELS